MLVRLALQLFVDVRQLDRAYGDASFEIVMGLLQFPFGALELADIERHSRPAQQPAVFIAHWPAAHEHRMPSPRAIANSLLAIPSSAGAHAFFPGSDRVLGIFGI